MFFDHGLLIDLIFCLFGTPFQQFSPYFHVCGPLYLTRIFFHEHQDLCAVHINFSKGKLPLANQNEKCDTQETINYL